MTPPLELHALSTTLSLAITPCRISYPACKRYRNFEKGYSVIKQEVHVHRVSIKTGKIFFIISLSNFYQL